MNTLEEIKKRPLCVALFFCIASFCLFSYSLALDSFLTLDDHPNLDPLIHVHSFSDAINYSAKSIAGHRYIAYFSFALQATSFQAENYFWLKLVNLLLHISNSLLIFFLLQQLLRKLLPKNQQSFLLSLLVSTLWLVHPIHVNTVLYTVQRMTLMASTFGLIGLNYAVHYYYKETRLSQGLSFADGRVLFIFSLLTALAIFSKESGILNYCFLILLLAIKPQTEKTSAFYCRITALATPILLLIYYLISANKLSYGSRSFTLAERLFTQPSIVSSYLDKLLFSWPSKYSLFYDHYAVVKSAWSASFFIPMALILILCSLAILLRRKHPVLSLGILWFFIGHLLESTVIPLELYFDHRNYLPSMGVFLCIGYLTLLALSKGTRLLRLVALLLLSLLIINTLSITYIKTSLWKNQTTFVQSSLIDNPSSERAWQQLAGLKIAQGNFPAALTLLDYVQSTFGYSNGNAIFVIWTKCILQLPWDNDYQQLLAFIPQRKNTLASSDSMRVLFSAAKDNYCPTMSIDVIRTLLKQYIASPKRSSEHYNMHFLMVETYLAEKNKQGAFNASLQLPDHLLTANFLLMQIDLAMQLDNLEETIRLYQKSDKLSTIDRKTHQKQFNKVAQTLADQ